ncbi:MAG: hypothetical protein R6X08_09215 [Desulfosalsimonadaceae bacterium]
MEPCIAVFVATSLEYHLLRKALSRPASVRRTNISYISGRLGGRKILLIKTGMGLRNAQRAYAEMSTKGFPMHSVINIGTGGALNPDYLTGDVALVDRVVQESDGAEYAPAQIAIKPRHCVSLRLHWQSTLISVAKPVDSRARRHYYRNNYNADVADMEAAAFMKGAVNNGIPCYIIKGISDSADDLPEIFQNIFNAEGKFNSRQILSLLVRNPLESLKSFSYIYNNSKLAMKNAVRLLERVI